MEHYRLPFGRIAQRPGLAKSRFLRSADFSSVFHGLAASEFPLFSIRNNTRAGAATPVFMRIAGQVQSCASKSISSQRRPSASPVLDPVRQVTVSYTHLR